MAEGERPARKRRRRRGGQRLENGDATQSSSQKQDTDEQLNDVSMAAQAETDAAVDALDAVLDDIESTLESNAEEYVNSFVQKGGE